MRLRALLLVGAALSGWVSAQSTQGIISGRVVDSVSGAPIAGAAIECEAVERSPGEGATSGETGWFAFPPLAPGHYTMSVAKDGYQALHYSGFDLPVAGRLELDLHLRPLGDVWESGQFNSVFLQGRKALLRFYGPDVDTSRSQLLSAPAARRGALESTVSLEVEPVEIEGLPLAGRDIYSALVLLPGVSADTRTVRGLGLFANGQRSTASNFLLDGVENNDYVSTGPLVGTAPESVQEYRISTNGYSAEYGKSSGVVANAITRAGGDAWHGLAYVYTKNAALDANEFQRNLAGLRQPPLHEWQPGLQGGGPLLKHRLFGSLSYEYLRSRSYGDAVQVQLPSTAFLHSLQLDAAIPSAADALRLITQHPFTAPVSANNLLSAVVSTALPVDLDRSLALARLDYLFSNAHRFMFRANLGDSSRPDFVWSPYRGFGSPFIERSLAVMGGVISNFRPGLANEARTSSVGARMGWDRAHPEIPALQAGDGTILPGSLAAYGYSNKGRTTELNDTLTWVSARHTAKFGGGLLARQIAVALTYGQDGLFRFNSELNFLAGQPTDLLLGTDRSAATPSPAPYYRQYGYTQYQVFAQDTVRVTRRLTMSAGLRYENFGTPANMGDAKDMLLQLGTGSTLDQRVARATLQLPASGDQTVFPPYNGGLAGRFGASYALSASGNHLLRTAYGIFYDRPFENLWQDEMLNRLQLSDFTLPRTGYDFLAPLSTAKLGFPGGAPDPNLKITWIDPRLRAPYAQDFFFGYQGEWTRGLTAEVNYQGALGRRLITTDILDRDYANPVLPQIYYRANQGASTYNALAALLRYRTRAALLQASYTWSHSIDNQSSPLAGDFFDLSSFQPGSSRAFEVPAAFSTEQNARADKGSSDFDQRHILTLMSLADLPSLNTRLLRGWKAAGLASFRTGFPFSVYSASSPLNMIDQRASLSGTGPVRISQPATGGEALLNPAAFIDPGAAQGNTGRNAFSGPGAYNIDLSLSRTIAIGERIHVIVRADSFNVLNHANLAAPNSSLRLADTFGVAQFGRLTQPSGFPGLIPLAESGRQLQLSLRVQW